MTSSTFNTRNHKLIISAALLAIAGTIGCSTPAYSGKERFQQIGRNISLEAGMMQDDIDRALLLRPVTASSTWNVSK